MRGTGGCASLHIALPRILVHIRTSAGCLLASFLTRQGRADARTWQYINILLFDCWVRGCTSSFAPFLPCRLLKPGGALLPDIATLHLAGAGANAGGLGFWSNMYGFDMSPVASALREAASRDAVVAPVQLEELVTPPVQLHSFDLAAMTPSDADFTAEFHIQPDRQQVCDCAGKQLVEHGKIGKHALQYCLHSA